jgi:spore coat protein U-like protein
MLIAWAGSVSDAEAQSIATTTMRVGAAVAFPCILFTTAISFGNYDPAAQATTDLTGVGWVNIGCSPSTVQVTISEGIDPDPSSTPSDPLRRMQNGGDYLNYDLCVDAACSTLWTAAPAGVPVNAPFPKNVPIYGRVNMGQSPPVGTYTDTVVINVSF